MDNCAPDVAQLESQDRQRRPRQDSNLRSRLRRAVLYPLSYGGRSLGCRIPRFARAAGG